MSGSTDDDLLARLRRSRDRVTDLEDELEEVGEDRARAAASAVRTADRLLDQYEDSAVGTGDFESYVAFQDQFASHVEGLDADAVGGHDAFEAALEAIEKRRLRERDFEQAREALQPARELRELLDEREEAAADYRDARHEVEQRLADVDERIADLERLQRLGEADLDAPVERLREPVEAYNEAVSERFQSFLESESAREVLGFVEATGRYPLVAFRQPPADLAAYVADYPAGEEPIPKLLEYADYSASKLDHYVDDPGALRARVATHRTYLTRLDAEPLTVSWPPRAATELRYRADELLSLLERFADEETAATLRAVRELTRREDFERLRNAARAHAELDAEERERLATGEVAVDLERARERRAGLADALESHPAP